MLSYTEENYLKAIYHLGNQNPQHETSTNTIADFLKIKPATVTSMLKKLRDKKLVLYQRYGKIKLSVKGKTLALYVVRKHRLWEVFLVSKLQFSWDEVHEIAEQLEHIQSEKLIDKLDTFLGHPQVDPHGDPIPDKEGNLTPELKHSLADAEVGVRYKVLAVRDSSRDFLQYLMHHQITLQTPVKIIERFHYDRSVRIQVGTRTITLSEQAAGNILIG